MSVVSRLKSRSSFPTPRSNSISRKSKTNSVSDLRDFFYPQYLNVQNFYKKIARRMLGNSFLFRLHRGESARSPFKGLTLMTRPGARKGRTSSRTRYVAFCFSMLRKFFENFPSKIGPALRQGVLGLYTGSFTCAEGIVHQQATSDCV